MRARVSKGNRFWCYEVTDTVFRAVGYRDTWQEAMEAVNRWVVTPQYYMEVPC